MRGRQAKKTLFLIIINIILISFIACGDNKTDVPTGPPVDKTPPIPGDTGKITADNIEYTTLTLNWTKATDDFSTQANISYKVYMSLTDNIATLGSITRNGTVLTEWQKDIATLDVENLLAATTYYFSILVKDEKENTTSYQSTSIKTLSDTTPPVVGAKGAITVDEIMNKSITLKWTKATDDLSKQNKLRYKIYYSEKNNISDLKTIEENGTLFDNWITDIDTIEVTELKDDNEYYFNIVVRDEFDNKSLYTAIKQATAFDDKPTQGNSGTLTTSDLDTMSLTLNWTLATDDFSSEENLLYIVYYSSSDNIQIKEDIIANGTAFGDWTGGVNKKEITGLHEGTDYYFNILVKDESDNVIAYTSIHEKTVDDTTPPVAGNSGEIATSNVEATKLILSWSKATDDCSPQTGIQYQIYYSESNNIVTYADILTNGTAFGTWQTDIGNLEITGLKDNRSYFFNIIVKDEAGNESCYAYAVQVTAFDTTAPVPGGAITTSNIQYNSLDISWPKATDDCKEQNTLKYRVFYSAFNNISNVFGAQNNGTPVGDWETDITTKSITGLEDGKVYYFNVLVWDQEKTTPEKANIGAYTAIAKMTTIDIVLPTPAGVLTSSNIEYTSITINWTKATDDLSAQADLEYMVFYSTANNITTVADAIANGISVGGAWEKDIATKVVPGLSDNTLYYFNVIVRDEEDNRAIYTMISETSKLDTVAPTPSGILSTSDLQYNQMTLNWAKATDDLSAQSTLQYRAYYSTSNNITTAATAQANGTPVGGGWGTDIDTKIITGLDDGTTYYLNVLVQDENGNIASYTSISSATVADIIPPVSGNSGTLSVSNIDYTSIRINWTKGTDDLSSQPNLQYRVFYSTSNNISTVATAESNGTPSSAWTTDIALKDVTGLTANVLYYFNVLIMDEENNKTAYTTISQKTLIKYQKISDTVGSFGGTLANSDQLGRSVGNIGTLDGDGINDIVIGTPSDDDGGTDRGAVWITFLNSNGTVKGEQKISDTAGSFAGVLDDADYFGLAACGIGDLDSDGIEDIVVGAPNDDDGGTNRGAVWVIFLNTNGTVKAYQKISDIEGSFTGTLDDNDNFGHSVTNLGDLDGGGGTTRAIAVGAPYDDDGNTNHGAVWILFLNTNGTVSSFQKISDTEGSFSGILSNDDNFGFSVSSIGDLNGNSRNDLAVGEPYNEDGGTDRGGLWILFLNANGTVASQQKISDTDGSFTGDLSNNDNLGYSVAGVGDLDGDAKEDIIVGSFGDDDGGANKGAVWIMYLNTNGTVKSYRKISNTEGGFTGTLDIDDRYGSSICSIGDINSDGKIDFATGANYDDDGGYNHGAVWIMFY